MSGKSYKKIQHLLNVVRNVILRETDIYKAVHLNFVGRWIINCFKGTQFEYRHFLMNVFSSTCFYVKGSRNT